MPALVESNIIGVMVYVKQLKEASDWYCSKLGFELGAYEEDDFAELMIDDSYVMHLFRDDNCMPYARAAFTFSTDNIAYTHGVLKRRGVQVEPILTYSDDHQSFVFRDCEGNALMVSQF
ncbi:VOC family protein [Paenibacillus sp. PR3]|uniref:VOC family protein n=1 Tax=Paenibacillus terricola TaxID=2763503 RepID=A0ABR8MRB5_9BACL|nr:VOC family protein [Paenibacillus terricola]MBD3918536.1 VOC family protein [Paenibacillus terricola]